MKSDINNKMQSHRRLFEVMEKYLNKWTHIEQFKSTYDKFVFLLC